MKAEWKCPGCGVGSSPPTGFGFICECEDEGTELHGTSPLYPCTEAICGQCGQRGVGGSL